MDFTRPRLKNFGLIALFFLTLAIGLTLIVSQRRQELRKPAAPATTLQLEPQSAQVDQGDAINFDVVMNTGTNLVTEADITIRYDPLYLEGISLSARGVFAEVIDPGIVQNGVANIRLKSPQTQPVTGTQVIATLSFRARNPVDMTSVSFDASTEVRAIAEPGNVVSLMRESQVEISRTVIPDTALSFVPTTAMVSPGQEFSVEVMLDTGDNQVTTADVTINYDAQILEGREFIPDAFLPVVLSPGTNSNGTARITLGSRVSEAAQGRGRLGILRFRAVKSGSTTLVFNPVTLARAYGSDENMVRERGTASVAVAAISPSPSPSPVIFPTPSPVATVAPSASPQLFATPTPAPSPGIGGPAATPAPTPASGCARVAPLAPTGVYTTIQGFNQITLHWNESVYATHYGIVLGPAPGDYRHGAANVGYTTSYTVSGLADNTTYYLAVFAVNDCAPSGLSPEVVARTLARPVAQQTGPAPTISTTPVVQSPSPIPGMTPISDGVEPIPFLVERRVAPSPVAFVPPRVPAVSVPPEFEVEKQELESSPSAFVSLLSPLGGILLIIVALFLGIFFWRMRHHDHEPRSPKTPESEAEKELVLHE